MSLRNVGIYFCNPEHQQRHFHRRENLKSHTSQRFSFQVTKTKIENFDVRLHTDCKYISTKDLHVHLL
jgi:hypothetical protein